MQFRKESVHRLLAASVAKQATDKWRVKKWPCKKCNFSRSRQAAKLFPGCVDFLFYLGLLLCKHLFLICSTTETQCARFPQMTLLLVIICHVICHARQICLSQKSGCHSKMLVLQTIFPNPRNPGRFTELQPTPRFTAAILFSSRTQQSLRRRYSLTLLHLRYRS